MLAELASQLLAPGQNWRPSDVGLTYKDDGSPVTAVDLELNERVTEFVSRAWPGIWIVSEEVDASLDVPDPSFVAVVDPLDGTENYISGLPIWGVSVAVWVDGVHHSSMLAFPELGLSAVTGQPLRIFSSRIVGHPSSSPMSVLASHGSAAENRILGSAAFNLYCVATGRFATFANHTGARAWDILGGLNLAREHRCGVTVDGQHYGGEFLDPRGKYRFEVRSQAGRDPGQGLQR
jgi:myo-inositol-1(or 4)-monophosphatase